MNLYNEPPRIHHTRLTITNILTFLHHLYVFLLLTQLLCFCSFFEVKITSTDMHKSQLYNLTKGYTPVIHTPHSIQNIPSPQKVPLCLPSSSPFSEATTALLLLFFPP